MRAPARDRTLQFTRKTQGYRIPQCAKCVVSVEIHNAISAFENVRNIVTSRMPGTSKRLETSVAEASEMSRASKESETSRSLEAPRASSTPGISRKPHDQALHFATFDRSDGAKLEGFDRSDDLDMRHPTPRTAKKRRFKRNV